MSKTQAWATGYSKINITLGPAYPQVKERVTCDTLSGSWAMQLELVESSRTSHLFLRVQQGTRVWCCSLSFTAERLMGFPCS